MMPLKFARLRCQRPLTPSFRFPHSLQRNQLDAEAAKYLSEGLKENEALTSLEYAASRYLSTVSAL